MSFTRGKVSVAFTLVENIFLSKTTAGAMPDEIAYYTYLN